MLGFYPSKATTHNDLVRAGKRLDAWSKEITAGFVDAARKASISGDRAELLRIKKDVVDWNRANHKTPFFIANFASKVQRSVKAGEQTTSGRYLQTTSKNIRPFIKDWMGAYGLSAEGVLFDEE